MVRRANIEAEHYHTVYLIAGIAPIVPQTRQMPRRQLSSAILREDICNSYTVYDKLRWDEPFVIAADVLYR